MKIYCLAERGHTPKLPERTLQRCRELWATNPLDAMLMLESMKPGYPTRTRLDKMLGHPIEHVSNLLPPSRICGEWDARAAARNAAEFWEWCCGEDDVRLVVLGARVWAALSPRVPWVPGMVATLKDLHGNPKPPVLCLPHPSGRSRVLNDRATADRIKGKVEGWISNFVTKS